MYTQDAKCFAWVAPCSALHAAWWEGLLASVAADNCWDGEEQVPGKADVLSYLRKYATYPQYLDSNVVLYLL